MIKLKIVKFKELYAIRKGIWPFYFYLQLHDDFWCTRNESRTLNCWTRNLEQVKEIYEFLTGNDDLIK